MSDKKKKKKEALTLLQKRSQQLMGIYGDLGGAVSGAAKLINELPTANRPQGEWLWQLADNGWADHICSVCGYTKNTDIHVSLNWSYCPNCGADMRKGVNNE